MNDRDEPPVWFFAAAAALIVFAAALRLRLGASLFEDEVWLADLVRNGGMHPHSYNVPPLFYAIERLWTSLRGTSVEAMREPPAFFGVVLAALPFAAVHFDRLTRFTWSALFAFSSPLLFYSTRIKQYTLEAVACTLLLILWTYAEERESRTARIAFFVASLIGVMALHGPVFICAAAFAAAVLSPRARRLPVLAGFGLVFAAFAAAWFGWLAPGPETTELHGNMTIWFEKTGRWVTSPHLLIDNTKHWLGQAFNLVRFWWLAAAGVVIAMLVSKLRPLPQKIALLLFAILPPAAALVLSTRHIYPYGEVRLMLFAFPALYLLAAISVATVARRVPLILLVLVPFAMSGAVSEPYNRTYMHAYDLMPFFGTIVANHTPGEPIYAHPSLGAPLRYHYPQLARDIRLLPQTPSPGWYLRLGDNSSTAGSAMVIRSGNAVAVRWR